MIETFIVGARSNLSNELQKAIKNSTLVESSNTVSLMESLIEKDQSFNLILNNFQPARFLNSFESLSSYIDLSISLTAKIFDLISKKPFLLKKIIYTSSSSVYGENHCCNESDIAIPSNLHSSLKLANEMIVSNICDKNNIDYTITRIFNLFGGKDNFSIISRIINAHQNTETLTIVNDGNAIRDFIHIKDVVNAYKVILKTPQIHLINIGSGNGRTVKAIISYMKNNGMKILTKNIYMEEINVSISDNSLLKKILPTNYKFESVFDFLSKENE